MTARELIDRKLQGGLTDLQALMLLALAERGMSTVTDLAADLGRPVNAVSMASNNLKVSGYLEKDSSGRRFTTVFYYLSDSGKRYVAWLLGKTLAATTQKQAPARQITLAVPVPVPTRRKSTTNRDTARISLDQGWLF